MHEFLTYKRLGSGARRFVITCLHDDKGETLLNKHPELLDSLHPADRPVFHDYLELDRDKGSWEFALALANELAKFTRVELLRVNLPRGVVDCNRVKKEDVFRNLWRGERSDFLEKYYEQVTSDLKGICENADFFLDVHTMAPFTPKPVIQEPGSLTDYIFSYQNSGGRRRSIDILTRDGEGTSYGDEESANQLLNAFKEFGFDCLLNDPYDFISSEIIFSLQLLKNAKRGFAIDIPKDLLVEEPFDLISSKVDLIKARKLAEILVNGSGLFQSV